MDERHDAARKNERRVIVARPGGSGGAEGRTTRPVRERGGAWALVAGLAGWGSPPPGRPTARPC